MPSVFGYELDSQVPLPRARGAEGGRGTIRIRLEGPDFLDVPAEVTGVAVAEGPPGTDPVALVSARAGEERIIGCTVTGGYRLDPARLRIGTAPTGPPEAWEHRLLAVAVPILLAERGELALHAAVVDIGGQAVLFCGPPGAGKSTLAAAFAAAGHGVLSEDGALLERQGERWIAWPGAAGARLRRADAGWPVTKRVVDLDGPEPGPLAVGSVVLLQPRGGDGRLAGYEPATALVEISGHLLQGGGIGAARPGFGLLAGLLGDVPAHRVSLPDDLGALPSVVSSLAEQMRVASAAVRG